MISYPLAFISIHREKAMRVISFWIEFQNNAPSCGTFSTHPSTCSALWSSPPPSRCTGCSLHPRGRPHLSLHVTHVTVTSLPPLDVTRGDKFRGKAIQILYIYYWINNLFRGCGREQFHKWIRQKRHPAEVTLDGMFLLRLRF